MKTNLKISLMKQKCNRSEYIKNIKLRKIIKIKKKKIHVY